MRVPVSRHSCPRPLRVSCSERPRRFLFLGTPQLLATACLLLRKAAYIILLSFAVDSVSPVSKVNRACFLQIFPASVQLCLQCCLRWPSGPPPSQVVIVWVPLQNVLCCLVLLAIGTACLLLRKAAKVPVSRHSSAASHCMSLAQKGRVHREGSRFSALLLPNTGCLLLRRAAYIVKVPVSRHSSAASLGTTRT